MLLEGKDLRQIGMLGFLAPGLKVPPPDPARPLVNPKSDDPGSSFLRSLAARGLAAGLGGVLYDNRDRGHSTLPRTASPPRPAGLRARPAPRGARLRAGRRDPDARSGAGQFLDALTEHGIARSLPRLAMTDPEWPARSFRSYASNQIYIYPEHRDHDDVDLFRRTGPTW